MYIAIICIFDYNFMINILIIKLKTLFYFSPKENITLNIKSAC